MGDETAEPGFCFAAQEFPLTRAERWRRKRRDAGSRRFVWEKKRASEEKKAGLRDCLVTAGSRKIHNSLAV